MKTKIVPALLLGLSLIGTLALAACKSHPVYSTDANGVVTTNTVRTLDSARIARVANEAASVGTMEILASHPEWTPQFQLAADQLHLLAQSPAINLQDILTIAQQLPVKELKSNTARLSFEAATILISAIDVPQLPADRLAELQPIARAIADGIVVGIANAPEHPLVKPAPPAPPAPAN